ncbi:MAG: hypothetical protein U9N86_02435 [Bacteroidota bacterium]|nr:hypothetical protein [Bacteroidota bacterium]
MNDTQAWSSWVNSSNTATIQDSLPIDPTSASISATQYVGTDIEFNCSGSTDVDNDAITYHVQFYNSNATTILQNYSSVTNYTVQTSDAHDSIRIRCKATTAVANSTGYYEASKIINDSLPTTPTTISLTSTIKVTETLEANCSGATDSDSDAITYSYQFYNTNASSILQDYSVTNTYTVLSTDAHDQIRVRCNATTTYISSSYKEENKSVLNTKPTQTSLLYPNDLQILTDNATVYLNWSTSIDVDGDTITYYVYLENNTPPSFNQSVSDSNLTLLTLMDDSYSWYVIAGDYNENNTNPGTISFTVDTSALNVTYTSPTPTHLERQINNYLYINVTVNHPSVNVDTCTLEWQGTNETMTMVGAGTSVYCYKNKTTVDGTEYIFTVFANNTASYIGTAGKRNNTENTIPSITSSDVTPAAPNRTSTLTCSPSGFLDDEADTAYYYYIWFNSTSRVAGQNTSTYDCSANGCNKTDIMTCQVTPFDDYENGTSFNSSETIENSQPTSPSSVYNLGEHLVDHTPEVNWTSGTDVDGDTIYTVVYVGINNTPTSPDGNETGSSYNLTFSLIDGTTYYYRARSYDGTSYSEYSSADEFRMNSLPSITIVAPNSTISFTSGNSTSLNYSAIDAEGDPIVYSIYDNSSSLLYSGIAKSTSYAYTYDGVYDWVVNVSDTYEVGTQPANFTVAIPPKLSNASLSATSGVNDAAFIIYINASDNTKLEWVKVNITDPNGFIANSSGVFMSPGNVDGQQNYTYSPSTDGIYTFHFFAMDINGNPVNFSSSLTYSESTSASPPSGGGGGGSKIVEVALTGNITAFCGDGICQDGENPFSCSSDCKVNFDTLITCLWDSEIECNWEQSWFPFVLLFGLISVGLYSFYSLQVVKK